MSLFNGLTFCFPNREASSEQFSAVLPLQLQKDKCEKKQHKIGNSKSIRTSQYFYYYTQKHYNNGAITLYNIENYVTNSVKKRNIEKLCH